MTKKSLSDERGLFILTRTFKRKIKMEIVFLKRQIEVRGVN